MKKVEYVYRELLFQSMEKRNFEFKQIELAEQLGVSLTNVNHALQMPKKMNAVRIGRSGLTLTNPKKLLYYWATARNPERDIIYRTAVNALVTDIEKSMPPGVVFGAYSAYKFRFNSTPADYGEVYVYSDDAAEVEKRFPYAKGPEKLFVLQKDPLMQRYGKLPTTAQIFVDLWNLPQWYAMDFLKELEGRLAEVLE